MAHEIENMFFVGEMPWHGLGVKVDENINVADAIVAAGLDWNVNKIRLTMPITEFDENGIAAVRHVATDNYAMVRSSDNSILGYAGAQYKPLQNGESFDWFQPILDAGLAKLHTAGSLRDGQRTFVLAKVCGANMTVGGDDEIAKFILLSNSHDGKTAVKVGSTPIRVVCANTLKMAYDSAASKLVRVKHSQQVSVNLDKLRDVFDAVNGEFAATLEQYQALARRQINSADLEKYVRIVLNVTDETTLKDLPTRTQNRISEVVRLFETGKGANMVSAKGTLWGAYNAITESLTWQAGRNVDNRMNNLWFGAGDVMNKLAFDTALAMAV